MKRKLLATAVLSGVVALWPLTAGANGGYGWTTTTEQDTTTTTEDTSSTSTTTSESTTTTAGGDTTTTLPAETTTVPGDTTTTTQVGTTYPWNLVTTWTASSTCHLLTAEWGEGIERVDLYQRLPEGDFGPDDGISGFDQSGDTIDTTGAFADSEWILVPVVETGFVASPDEIHLFTEECTPTTIGSTTTDPTLPLTGVSEFMWTTLGFAGLVSLVLGWVFLMSSRDEE